MTGRPGRRSAKRPRASPSPDGPSEAGDHGDTSPKRMRGGETYAPAAQTKPLKLKLKLSPSPKGRGGDAAAPPATAEISDASESEPTESEATKSEATKSIDTEEEELFMDDISLVYGRSSRKPERMTARQRAMVYGDNDDGEPGSSGQDQVSHTLDWHLADGIPPRPLVRGFHPWFLTLSPHVSPRSQFKGGIDAVFAKPKKALTEEQLMKKAELNEERRRRASRMKKEQQVAAQKAIREGKGAKAKREEKIMVKREERLKKRENDRMVLEDGIMRVVYRAQGNFVAFGGEEWPDALNQPPSTRS